MQNSYPEISQYWQEKIWGRFLFKTKFYTLQNHSKALLGPNSDKGGFQIIPQKNCYEHLWATVCERSLNFEIIQKNTESNLAEDDNGDSEIGRCWIKLRTASESWIFPVTIYMFKVNNKDTTANTIYSAFTVDIEQISVTRSIAFVFVCLEETS